MRKISLNSQTICKVQMCTFIILNVIFFSLSKLKRTRTFFFASILVWLCFSIFNLSGSAWYDDHCFGYCHHSFEHIHLECMNHSRLIAFVWKSFWDSLVLHQWCIALYWSIIVLIFSSKQIKILYSEYTLWLASSQIERKEMWVSEAIASRFASEKRRSNLSWRLSKSSSTGLSSVDLVCYLSLKFVRSHILSI